jgi:hypothetical protein
MSDKTVKNRDWSNAIGGQALRLFTLKVLEKKQEAKKIREFTKGKEAIRPALRPISKK